MGLIQNDAELTKTGLIIADIHNKIGERKRLKGNLACGWCGINTLVLHEHHYPIPRSQDGTKTVSICPNCHYEFHTMKYLMEVLV